ncbi:Bll5565 protein [hydrothermal vent metagenome]|uniref:Bll5565 protein n=1 Tax=hydrothermal vent metagenome TaxID=652676 RepID=A0A1W1CSC7_9ZZZZ
MLIAMKNKILSLLQFILVIIYILFEALIWDGIAKPIYEAIHSLKILQKLEAKLQRMNASVILGIFIFLLTLVEVFGLYAGVLFVSGQVGLGLTLYIAKIPVAAFTFWLFRVTEDKLMQFAWFKWLYDKLIAGIEWLKSREIYKKTMEKMKLLKENIKAWYRRFKEKYLSRESVFLRTLKQRYQVLKERLKKK